MEALTPGHTHMEFKLSISVLGGLFRCAESLFMFLLRRYYNPDM
jgi:hypothetical protein